MKKFDKCVICNRKIGWFRRWRTRRLDLDPLHLIPLSQFCSNKCADDGLNKILKKIEKGRLVT